MDKNKGGRPPTYKVQKEMQDKIDEYFEICKGNPYTDINGDIVFNKYDKPVIIDSKVPTITGLALHLGFNGRKSLMDYSGKPEFVNTITRAKAKCEEYAESRLYDRDGSRGAEFSLRCNFGWNIKSENDINGNNGILDNLSKYLESKGENNADG